MPYFAANNMVSQAPIAGGVQITAAQYKLGLDALLGGGTIAISGGFKVIPPQQQGAPPDHGQEPAKVTVDDVAAERDRRLELGFDLDFGDDRGLHRFSTRTDDMRRWMDEVTPLSQAYLNVGQPDGEIGISTETGSVTITALEWQHILLAASSRRQPLYQASFALQALDPIPTDYASDAHWPA